jgi:TonB family protein
MGALSNKIRSGVLELSTDTGPVYAAPSISERIYLLWTFRNFRRLPKQVLNPRQRQLIDKLCHSPTPRQNGPLIGTPIIGVVENVHLLSDRKAPAAANPNKLVEMASTSVKIELPRAVGGEGFSIPLGQQPYSRTAKAAFERRRDTGRALTLETSRKADRASAQPGVSGAWGKYRQAFVAAMSAALLAGLLYLGNTPYTARPVALQLDEAHARPTPAQAAADLQTQQSESPSISNRKPKPSAARPAPQVQLPIIAMQPAAPPPAIQAAAAITGAIELPARGTASTQNGATAVPELAAVTTNAAPANAVMLPERAVVTTKAAPADRVAITAAPQSFSYPAAPNAALTGKVYLRLVIGTDGSVKDVAVLSGKRALADAAVRAARRWRYRALELNGSKVEGETSVAINFAGNDAVSIRFVQ